MLKEEQLLLEIEEKKNKWCSPPFEGKETPDEKKMRGTQEQEALHKAIYHLREWCELAGYSSEFLTHIFQEYPEYGGTIYGQLAVHAIRCGVRTDSQTAVVYKAGPREEERSVEQKTEQTSVLADWGDAPDPAWGEETNTGAQEAPPPAQEEDTSGPPPAEQPAPIKRRGRPRKEEPAAPPQQPTEDRKPLSSVEIDLRELKSAVLNLNARQLGFGDELKRIRESQAAEKALLDDVYLTTQKGVGQGAFLISLVKELMTGWVAAMMKKPEELKQKALAHFMETAFSKYQQAIVDYGGNPDEHSAP